jgi:hypothetical protein
MTLPIQEAINMRPILLIFTVIIMMSPLSKGQERQLPVEEITEIATDALGTFMQLVDQRNYRTLGFESPEEVREASLGPYLQEYSVRLDRLREFRQDQDPEQLLSGGELVYFPVTVRGEVRSSIIVDRIQEQWQAANFGNAHLIRILTSMRQRQSEAHRISPESFFVVRIPALNMYFLGYRDEARLQLIPTEDDESLGFVAGTALPAVQVFDMLIPAAREHDDLPR